MGIKLDIVFGLDREIERISQTLKRLPWYREQGYGESHVLLPKGLSESCLQEIQGVVSSEFSEGAYDDLAKYIEAEWLKVSEGLENLKEMPSFRLLGKYIIILTKYGSGGSYDSEKGEVIVNFGFPTKTKEKIVGTIIHEIIHIGIQYLISKHEVGHWRKERLVDLIGKKYFPLGIGLGQIQNIKEDVTCVDEVFSKYFPDIEAIISSVGAKRA